MIVYKADYYGVHPDLIPALEAIAQATVDELFALCQAIYADRSIEVWNCSVYRSVVTQGRTKFKRLRIVNHSCGYWAVLQWGHPHPDLEGYEEMVDFWFYANEGKGRTVDWDKFEDDWGYGRCDLFMKARKNSKDKDPEERTWYAPTHALSFKHPLLYTLRNAVEIR